MGYVIGRVDPVDVDVLLMLASRFKIRQDIMTDRLANVAAVPRGRKIMLIMPEC
jgi:hypothetical protein